jgi:toxin HigB-1
MDSAGMNFHALRGDQTGRFSVLVTRNWRITFGWDDAEAVDLDLEDYHGQ